MYKYSCTSSQNISNVMKECFYGEKDVSNSRGIFYFTRNEADASGILEVLHF